MTKPASGRAQACSQKSWFFYPQLPPLLPFKLAGPAPPWLHPDSVGCWDTKPPERDPLYISGWGAFPPHDVVTHQFLQDILTSAPCQLYQSPLIRYYNLGLDRPLSSFIFFLVPTKICYHFNLPKSPSRTRHSHTAFSLHLRLSHSHCWNKSSVSHQQPSPWKTHLRMTVPNPIGEGAQGAGAFIIILKSAVFLFSVLLYHSLSSCLSQDWGFPGGAGGKEPTCQCRRCMRLKFYPSVRKIPWRRKWQPTPVFLPGEFHRQRSLVDSSPWGHKESDTIVTLWQYTYI